MIRRYLNEHKVVSLLLLLGVIVVLYRLFAGLGAVSALSDPQPWGLIKALNILALAALASGATVVAAMVHVFGMRRFKPLVRPALLMGFITHTFVLAALLYDVGSPIDIWRIIISPNLHSLMFLAFLCEVFYTAALISEVLPDLLATGRHEGLVLSLRAMHGPVVLGSAIMAVIYQSTLGALFLVSPHRISPLWYSQWLPAMFFISAVAAGLGMVVVEAYLSDRFGRCPWNAELMNRVGVVMAAVLAVYVFFRVGDLAYSGVLSGSSLQGAGYESAWFWVEIGLGFTLPALLLILRSTRESAGRLMLCSCLVAMGVVMNRLGVVMVGWRNPAGVTYFPSALEIYASFFFILAPVAIYAQISGGLRKNVLTTPA